MAKESKPKADAEPTTQKLLLVDDDRDILAGMKALFEGSGFEVFCASDGNAALAMAESEDPDLVVLDMMLPKRSGFLVLEKLKSKKRAQTPKVIMITGNEGQRHRTYAETLGVDDYIRKPFSMERLLERVQGMLS